MTQYDEVTLSSSNRASSFWLWRAASKNQVTCHTAGDVGRAFSSLLLVAALGAWGMLRGFLHLLHTHIGKDLRGMRAIVPCRYGPLGWFPLKSEVSWEKTCDKVA